MILTVTLNPSVDIQYGLKKFSYGEVNRCSDVMKTPGGKGLNVTRVLKSRNVPVMATGFLGGTNGTFIRESLEKLDIQNDFVDIEGQTRNCIAIMEDKVQTEILEAGPKISEEDMEVFLDHFEGLLEEAEIVTASGSLPMGVEKDFYATLIQISRKYNRAFMLDTSGESLLEGMKASPYLVKPNLEELEQITGKKMSGEHEIIEGMQSLSKYSIPMVIVTLGAEGAIAMMDGEAFYRVRVPEINAVNPVGSGDSTLAGYAEGVLKGKTVMEILKLGAAYGVLNAMSGITGSIDVEKIDETVSQISVERIDER